MVSRLCLSDLLSVFLPAADAVFDPDEAERREYVLNDIGVIYQGSVGAVSHRSWMFGQVHRNTQTLKYTHTITNQKE